MPTKPEPKPILLPLSSSSPFFYTPIRRLSPFVEPRRPLAQPISHIVRPAFYDACPGAQVEAVVIGVLCANMSVSERTGERGRDERRRDGGWRGGRYRAR